MVNILVDEGYAYDVLSICQIKLVKKIANSEKNFHLINETLENQLKELHAKIISSNGYSSITAKEVDDLNMLRYKYKTELQKKFFPESIILEQKS